MNNAEQVRNRILELVEDKIGNAIRNNVNVKAIFIGTPDYDAFTFDGVICLINPIEQGTTYAVTGGAYQPKDWEIRFVQYNDKEKKTISEILETLKQSFNRVSHRHIPYDKKAKARETLIVNVPHTSFYFTE